MSSISINTLINNDNIRRFEVVVSDEDGTSTKHEVDLDPTYHLKLTGEQVSQESLIQKSFEFLLAREPKESILKSFHLSVIQRYFPTYEATMREWAENTEK